MSSDRRRYQLKARAVRQEDTRRRIVEATATLHEEIGPARTTVAEIARRAGVERLTVYNNYPELKDLLAACQRHFLADHPPPEILPSKTGEATVAGLKRSLTRLYAWYRENERIERNVHRDRKLVPDLEALMSANSDPHYEKAAQVYAGGIASEARHRKAAVRLLRVAMDFNTWELLTRSGANDAEIAKLFSTAARCVASES